MKSLKKVGVLFTLLITTLAMVGCASTTTEEKSTAMKTVQTDKGEVEIPENPKRIISDYYLGEFLAVGVKPIIASPYVLLRQSFHRRLTFLKIPLLSLPHGYKRSRRLQ